MYRYLNIFMNVFIVLLIIVVIVFSVTSIISSKDKNEENSGMNSYIEKVNNFDGQCVTDFYYVDISHFIVKKYINALKNNKSLLNDYLLNDINNNSINANIGDSVYIKEVKQNTDGTELLITYSTKKDKSDENKMFCKLNKDENTFLICYDSLLNY